MRKNSVPSGCVMRALHNLRPSFLCFIMSSPNDLPSICTISVALSNKLPNLNFESSLNQKFLKSSFLFRKIILGEHTLGTDPDCMSVGGRIVGCTDPIINRKAAQVFLHPNYNISVKIGPHDIALIRVDEIIPLYGEENSKSSVLPICLPWNSEDPGRKLQQGDRQHSF